MDDTFRTLPTRSLLRRVHLARAAGDWRSAEREWHACVARARERVAVVVDGFVARGGLSPSERDDVVQDALIRGAGALVENLESLEEEVFFAAMVRCARFQCLDAARRHVRRDRHEQSLDAPPAWADSGDPYPRESPEVARISEERWRREEEILEAGRAAGGLIDRLPDARQRTLLTLQRLGVADAGIAARMGISVANVQTIRYRALNALRGLIEP